MREILFRGKRKDNGEWCEGYYLHQRESLTDKEACYIAANSGYGFNYISVLPETVCQYTGLTDKNGRKIFEGDIVKTHYANAKKTDFVETVVFYNGKFCTFHSNNDCKQWTVLYDGVKHLAIDKSVYMDGVEIIGNIYDNPELLESEE